MHPRAGNHFHQVHEHLALAHGVKQHGHRAQVHGQRANDEQMARNPGEFGHQHAYILGAFGHLYVEQAFDGNGKSQVVGGRADVVQPVGQRKDLRIGEVLGQFLGAAVQVADEGVGALDDFPVHLQDEPQHAMGAGMLGSEVEQHFLR